MIINLHAASGGMLFGEQSKNNDRLPKTYQDTDVEADLWLFSIELGEDEEEEPTNCVEWNRWYQLEREEGEKVHLIIQETEKIHIEIPKAIDVEIKEQKIGRAHV